MKLRNTGAEPVIVNGIPRERNTWKVDRAYTREQLDVMKATREDEYRKLIGQRVQYNQYRNIMNKIQQEKDTIAELRSSLAEMQGRSMFWKAANGKQMRETSAQIEHHEAAIQALEKDLPQGQDRSWLEEHGFEIETNINKVTNVIDNIKNAIFSRSDADRQLEPPKKKKKQQQNQWSMPH